MRRIALAAITLYQRHLSPHKGFCCAYRVHTGRASCSALGSRAIRRFGVFDGIAVLRSRTRLCGIAHRRHQPLRRALHAQQGVCDVGCDLPCEPSCDLFSCCDCGSCDWFDRKKRKSAREERYVYIPPKSGRADGPGGAKDVRWRGDSSGTRGTG